MTHHYHVRRPALTTGRQQRYPHIRLYFLALNWRHQKKMTHTGHLHWCRGNSFHHCLFAIIGDAHPICKKSGRKADDNWVAFTIEFPRCQYPETPLSSAIFTDLPRTSLICTKDLLDFFWHAPAGQDENRGDSVKFGIVPHAVIWTKICAWPRGWEKPREACQLLGPH